MHTHVLNLSPFPSATPVTTTQMLDACLPRLLASPDAADGDAEPAAQSPSAGSGPGAVSGCADPATVGALAELHRRLAVLRAARQHAGGSLSEEQVRERGWGRGRGQVLGKGYPVLLAT